MSYRSAGLFFVLLATSCGTPVKDNSETTLGDTGGSSPTDTGGVVDETGINPDDGGLNVEVGNPEGGTATCSGKDPDCDMDGYPASKDCNDKDGTINPDAYDFPDDKIDNDCDGTVDNPVETCDPSPTSTTPLDYARAADLCPQHSISVKTGKPYDPIAKVEFGTLSGKTVLGSGNSITKTAATKIAAKFGDNAARKGGTLFGLQSGPFLGADPRASMPFDTLPITNACGAIPLLAADCTSLSNGTAGAPSVQDFQEVIMYIRVPSNAQAMSFDFAFFSSEFNAYWNSAYNDAFFVIVNGKKVAGANVAKDATGKAITINSGFFQLCPAAPGPSGLYAKKAGALANCVGVDGDASKSIFGTLKNTGFDGATAKSPTTDDTVMQPDPDTGSGNYKFIYGGGSGWLTTKFAVEPGESMVVRFMVMDTSDGALDSAAIVDNIRWDKAPPKVPTGEVERPPS